jgi:hypothetical protein
MTTTIDHQWHEINSADARRRQIRVVQVIFAGAATITMFALFNAARPAAPETVVASGSMRLVDQATDLPAPAAAPFGAQFSQTPPSVIGGFAADDDDQAQLQEQLAQQETQQAEQQAEEQNEQAEQQAMQDELQAQQTEQQASGTFGFGQ